MGRALHTVRQKTLRLPGDLAFTVTYTAIVNAVVFLPLLRTSPLRTVLGFSFVVTVPGYAVVSALFPAADRGTIRRRNDREDGERFTGLWAISDVERAVLSLALSISVIPLVGMGLSFTPWGIQVGPVMSVLTGVTFVAIAVAAYRRSKIPPSGRFAPGLFSLRPWKRGLGRLEGRSAVRFVLLLVVVPSLAAASVGFAFITPSPADATTSLYLLTENDRDELVTSGYPENMTVGKPSELIVGVNNDELKQARYTIVVQLQRVNRTTNGVEVVERRQVGRFEPVVADGGQWRRRHQITPTMKGEHLRLLYLLYKGEPPEKPTAATAYRTAHLWVDVEEANGDADQAGSSTRSRNRIPKIMSTPLAEKALAGNR